MSKPRFPRFEQALRAYGDNAYAQAKAIGMPYTTLRELLAGRASRNLIRLACRRDLLDAFREDVVAQEGVLCPETEERVSAAPIPQ